MKRRLTVEEIPELPGYSTVAAVAEQYGMAKGSIYNMLFSQKRFPHAVKVTKGGNGGDKRPLILLLDTEVKMVFGQKSKDEVHDPELARKRTEWSKRVKSWGRSEGWTETPIAISGPPHNTLVVAYLAANPDDPRPEAEDEPETD